MVTNAHVTALITDEESGEVTGVRYRQGQGDDANEEVEMLAASVVLTTGGEKFHWLFWNSKRVIVQLCSKSSIRYSFHLIDTVKNSNISRILGVPEPRSCTPTTSSILSHYRNIFCSSFRFLSNDQVQGHAPPYC